jgi:polyphosphate kinase
LGSADWMPRNLHERVEVMFPVKGQAHRTQITEILNHYLRDTAKSRMLHASGKYLRAFHGDSSKASRNGNRFSVQNFFIDPPESAPASGIESARALLATSTG